MRDESQVQGRDFSQPEVTRVQVRAHQRTMQDGRVVNVRSHSRSKGKGRSVTFSPSRATLCKGGFKGKGKGKSGKQGKRIIGSVSAVSSENELHKRSHTVDQSVQSGQKTSQPEAVLQHCIVNGIHPGQSHKVRAVWLCSMSCWLKVQVPSQWCEQQVNQTRFRQ
eukprot:559414-Amphidinium_carterae.2